MWKGLVRESRPGGAKGQYLPQLLPRAFQKIHKFISFLRKGSDSILEGRLETGINIPLLLIYIPSAGVAHLFSNQLSLSF